jgi:CxxC motif-containing protein
MKKSLICIVCPMGCHLSVDIDNDYKVEGNRCPRGIAYAKKELTNPTRTVTSTVKIKDAEHKRIPVKTDKEIPKDMIFDIMKVLDTIEVSAPIKIGEIIIEDVLGTNANIVATRSIKKTLK